MNQAIIFNWISTLYERDKGPFPFSEEILQELKSKYKLGLVSLAGKGLEIRQQEIKNSRLFKYFDSIIIDTSKTKEHFLKCMKEVNSISKNTLVVDDRMSRGIKVGKELNCKTYGIQVGDRSFDKPTEEIGEPDYKINSIKELPSLLN